MMTDLLGYAGKRVVVTGCSSGIGHATTALLIELGAEVHGLDRNPTDLSLASFGRVDLGDPSSIDTASVEGSVDALFNCVGLSPTQAPADVVRVNFLGVRHLTQRLLPRMQSGASIVNVSSTGGARWREHLTQIDEFIATDDFEAGVDWLDANSAAITNAYAFSKEALIVWSLRQSLTLIKQGIRMNCASPGAVQTAMLEDIEARFSSGVVDAVAEEIGRRSSPVEQAWPLVFLASPAASYINGVDLAVDGGWAASAMLKSAV